jgi:glycosyltransferase involved in cell wall biosynthesis
VQDNVNGLLVPVQNTSALVSAMNCFIENRQLGETFGIRGRSIAERKYDVELVNEAIVHIMNL